MEQWSGWASFPPRAAGELLWGPAVPRSPNSFSGSQDLKQVPQSPYWSPLAKSVHPSIRSSIRPPIHILICSVHLFNYSSIQPYHLLAHLYMYEFIHPSIHLSIHPSTCPSSHPSIHLSTHPYPPVYLPVCSSIYPPTVHLLIYPSLHPPIHLFSQPAMCLTTFTSLHPAIYPSINSSIIGSSTHPFTHPSIHPPICLPTYPPIHP